MAIAVLSDALQTSGHVQDIYGNQIPVQKTFANVAASQTDSVLVRAMPGYLVRVMGVGFVAGATATNITFNTKPSGSGTAITNLWADQANSGAILPMNVHGWFDTNTGEGLTVTTGSGSTTGILVNFIMCLPKPFFYLASSDSVTVGEAVTTDGGVSYGEDVSDSVTTSEAVSLLTTGFIAATQSITVADSAPFFADFWMSVADSATVGEAVTVGPPQSNVSKYEGVSVGSFATLTVS